MYIYKNKIQKISHLNRKVRGEGGAPGFLSNQRVSSAALDSAGQEALEADRPAVWDSAEPEVQGSVGPVARKAAEQEALEADRPEEQDLVGPAVWESVELEVQGLASLDLQESDLQEGRRVWWTE
jgi:hypothetical protein